MEHKILYLKDHFNCFCSSKESQQGPIQHCFLDWKQLKICHFLAHLRFNLTGIHLGSIRGPTLEIQSRPNLPFLLLSLFFLTAWAPWPVVAATFLPLFFFFFSLSLWFLCFPLPHFLFSPPQTKDDAFTSCCFVSFCHFVLYHNDQTVFPIHTFHCLVSFYSLVMFYACHYAFSHVSFDILFKYVCYVLTSLQMFYIPILHITFFDFFIILLLISSVFYHAHLLLWSFVFLH